MIGDRRATGEQRDQGHQRNEGEVLKQQHGEGIAAGGACEKLPLREHWEHDGGRGHCQACPEHDRTGPCDPGQMGEGGQDGCGRDHLRGSQTEDRAAHDP